jgi:hypothetical protein
VVGLPCACLLRSFSIFYSKCGVCAFSSHSLYVSTVGLSDETFTVLFVQLCLVPCDVLTVLNHVYFPPSPARFGLMDPSLARTLVSSLANPYALSNPLPPRQHANTHGYTYSSTYNPSISYPASTPSFPSTSRNPIPPRGAPMHWYTPGNSKCTHSGCTFTGSANTVQTHMMDRHLIYPPGWHARKRQPDWDADPSLKGYVLVHTQPGRGQIIALRALPAFTGSLFLS